MKQLTLLKINLRLRKRREQSLAFDSSRPILFEKVQRKDQGKYQDGQQTQFEHSVTESGFEDFRRIGKFCGDDEDAPDGGDQADD